MSSGLPPRAGVTHTGVAGSKQQERTAWPALPLREPYIQGQAENAATVLTRKKDGLLLTETTQEGRRS